MFRSISSIDKWILKYISEGLIVLDTETTGLSRQKDRIIEFAALKIKNNSVIDEISFLLQSDKPIPWEVTKINGITNDMLKSGLPEEQAVKKIIDFLEGDFIIVGHNVKFDIDFIEQLLKRHGYRFSCTYLDTLQLSRKYLKGLSSYSLGNIAEYYGFKPDGLHRALTDVETTYKLLNLIIREAIKN